MIDSSVGRALHRYRRGHGFESRSGLNFFRLLFHKCSSCVYNCDDPQFKYMIFHIFIYTSNSSRLVFGIDDPFDLPENVAQMGYTGYVKNVDSSRFYRIDTIPLPFWDSIRWKLICASLSGSRFAICETIKI